MGTVPSLIGRRDAHGAAKVGVALGRDEVNKIVWVQTAPRPQGVGTRYIRDLEDPIMWKK